MDKGVKLKENQMPHGTAVKGLHKWKKEVETIIQLTYQQSKSSLYWTF